MNILNEWRTLTGLTLGEAIKELKAVLPPSAYKAVPGSQGLTDIDPSYLTEKATEIFGRGGGERFAAQNGIEFLGGIPLDVTVRQGGDVGVPVVAQREPGPAAKALTHLAQIVAARMSVRAASNQQPVLSIS